MSIRWLGEYAEQRRACGRLCNRCHCFHPQASNQQPGCAAAGASEVVLSNEIEEKRQQHKTLLKALEMQGFDVRLLILTFGVGGTIYKRTQDYLEDVGIGPVEMKKLLKDIHLHSVEYLHNIVVQRRQLDSEALRHQTHRPP